jgi:hypothetical protein
LHGLRKGGAGEQQGFKRYGRGEGGEAGMGDRSMARVGGQPANGPQRQQPRREEIEDDKDIDELPF